MTFAINTIATSNETLTMSSREIAELTGKLHTHVIRDIRTMLEDLGDEPNLVHVAEEKDNRGYTACFNLPKELTITLISGYNVKMRHAITKRWMELEAAQAPALPRTYAEALMAAAQAEMAKEALALESAKKDEVIAEQAPKAEFFDELVDASEVYTPTQVANLLGSAKYKSAQKVNELLCELGWQYKRGRHWVVSALGVAKGFMQAKVFTNEDTGFNGTHVRITVAGLNTLRKAIND